MEQLKKYEEFMEEFSFKSYEYVGDVIKIDVQEEGTVPAFVMQSPELEQKLDLTQSKELKGILDNAMQEVLRNKNDKSNVKDFLGWSYLM